jgi:hypothetical protein
MPDSDPTHDNPKNTRNLPAVVQEGEVLRPASENWLSRAIRTLFGWKPGSVRDDLQVVLDASTPDEVGFSAIERTMLPIRGWWSTMRRWTIPKASSTSATCWRS